MGIANRTDFDLKQHAKASGKSLTYFDEERKEHVVPYVVEPAAGVDRALLAFLADAYLEEEVRGEQRVVLRFHPELAPVKVAVLPLLKKREDIVRTAQAIRDELSRSWRVVYDDTAAIGRLYRRQDEVGTPYCVTVDVQTVGDTDKGERADDKVTIRDRDSMEQIRVRFPSWWRCSASCSRARAGPTWRPESPPLGLRKRAALGGGRVGAGGPRRGRRGRLHARRGDPRRVARGPARSSAPSPDEGHGHRPHAAPPVLRSTDEPTLGNREVLRGRPPPAPHA